MTASPGTPASRELDPRVAAVLAYSGWWVTGALFLLLERDDARLRFHAAQAVVVFGAVSIAIGLALVAALTLVLVSTDAARVALWLANLGWLAGTLLWAWLTYCAARGQMWQVPGTGPFVARLAGGV